MTTDRPLVRLVRAWALIAPIDFAFASILTTVFYHATFASLWQRVASVPLGTSALDGGTHTVLIGIALHLCVAFTWSAVFLLLYLALSGLRRAIESTPGLLAVAALYGPCVWIMMSFVIIPRFTGRLPTVNFRWWVQFFGHIPFVALPITIGIRGFRSTEQFLERQP